MSKIGIIVYPGELPEKCIDCDFNIFHPHGEQFCALGCTRRGINSRPRKCPINVWDADPPKGYADWQARAGERLRALRESRQLSQSALEDTLGYTQAQVSAAERAQYLSARLMFSLCDFYGVNPAELILRSCSETWSLRRVKAQKRGPGRTRHGF